MSKLQRLSLVVLLLGASVGCDQATKYVATSTLKNTSGFSFLGDTFRLQYAENIGAFLSLGGTLPAHLRFWLLTVMVGLLLVGLLIYALSSQRLTRVEVAAYALIAGGGLSNWVDRLFTDGKVVDFMNMGIGPLRTGVFNVADLAIVGGIAMVVLAKRAPATAPPPPPSQPA